MKCDAHRVTPSEWRQAWLDARATGASQFDFLTGIDRGDSVEVVGHCFGADGSIFLATTMDGSDLPTIADVFPGTAWFEHELRERFSTDGAMRKTVPLPARLETPWPGTTKRPPGVLDTWRDES